MSAGNGPWVRLPSEFRNEMEEQIAALEASCRGYDEGNHWEAKRIASAVYIIAYDGPPGSHSRSILGHLGVLSAAEFVSSAKEDSPENTSAAWSLIHMSLSFAPMVDQRSIYVPMLDRTIEFPGLRKLLFQDWWNEVVLREPRKPGATDKTLTRLSLVKSMRDQDGGAHYDDKLKNETYAEFARRNAVGFTFVEMTVTQVEDHTPEGVQPGFSVMSFTGVTAKETPITVGPEFATMRQIGWEVLRTIDELRMCGKL